MLRKRVSAGVVLGVALASAAACSAGGASGGSHNGLANGGSANGNGTGNDTGSSATGNIVTSNGGGNSAPDGGCQHVEVNFVPKIPSIFVLVDRSDSMFTPDSKQVVSWAPLKAGVLAVIKQLGGQVRFGFGAFTGQQAQGAVAAKCPIFESIAPALNNADAISAVYQPLDRVMGAAGETPVIQVLPLVKDLLDQPGNDGDKYILFVTDGEPDFCDNGDAKCPVDAVVAGVQKLAAAGIHTIVFGLPSAITPISGDTLQAVANAGAGVPVATPFGTSKEQDVCYACQGIPGWLGQWTAAGSAPDCAMPGKQTLGVYGAAATNATVYHPDPADQTALTNQIASVVQGLKSCTFDLSEVSVDVTRLSEASVAIQGQPVPLSDSDGWRMNTPTQLELVGGACTKWNLPENTKIDFNFPCDIIIPK